MLRPMAGAPGTEAAPSAPERQRVAEPARQPAATTHALAHLGGAVGNRALARILARSAEGSGLLPGGVIHPEVEAAIAAVSGGGRPLERGAAEHLQAGYGTPLGDVRLHTDDHAASLARAVSAQAFTVGRDIFFGQDAYRPGTPNGDALVAHEVAHVVQQRGAPATGPLIATQPGDAAERGAEAAVRELDG